MVTRRQILRGAAAGLGGLLAGALGGSAYGSPAAGSAGVDLLAAGVLSEGGIQPSQVLPGRGALPEPTARKLPRWRGFNLLTRFNPTTASADFDAPDFASIAELGFNFVRLPLDYRFWTDPSDWTRLREDGLRDVDTLVGLGRHHGLHVCLNFHRAPGFTVAQPGETRSLWTDEEAQRVCGLHWAHFAGRYRGIPNRELSFNLINEPPALEPAVHRQVIERIVAAIRQQDDQRLIICDGRDSARTPPTELLGLGVAAATRGYDPVKLSHYRADWERGSDQWATPTYPLVEGDTTWDRDYLRRRYVEPWAALEAQGMGVLVAEFGAYNRTPHATVLTWMRDWLDLWREAGWGWALWNFRGPFGLIDSGRSDVRYMSWRGHRVDAAMLQLLLRA